MGAHVNNKEWTTQDEIKYLRTIGEHIKNSYFTRLSKPDRKKHKVAMLKRYLETAEKRVNWGLVSQGVAVRRAGQLLEALNGR